MSNKRVRNWNRGFRRWQDAQRKITDKKFKEPRYQFSYLVWG